MLYNEYLAKFRQDGDIMPLPMLQIWRACPVLIELLPLLKPDEKKPEAVAKFDATDHDMGDDPWDGFSYGAVAHKNIVIAPPKRTVIAAKMQAAREAGITDITLLSQVAMAAEKKWDERASDTKPLRAPRLAVPR
jgi:hypothetical protein